MTSEKTSFAQSDQASFPSNVQLAEKLATVSMLLIEQGANPFRSDAYQRAAETIRNLKTPVWKIYLEDGIAGLENIADVGHTIARALQQMIRGGKWALLERLTGSDVVEQAFASVPGIGEKLAKRIHDELNVETLAELQAAAWDGRLKRMGGFGEKRIRAIRESLAVRGRQWSEPVEKQNELFESDLDMTFEVPIQEILDVDAEYRRRVFENDLPRVAPRKMNPTAEAWLPILHTERGHRHYTALYSNTEHAHAMGTTHDWVVIYLEDHGNNHQHGRWTVITSRFGRLKGHRIVRGREQDCGRHYQNTKPASSAI